MNYLRTLIALPIAFIAILLTKLADWIAGDTGEEE